ncbi:hypothetical protein JXA40_00030 [bacterium]|nr:hypothetical protein [candidate division CSSED10-310 bacterium]
MKCLYLKSSLKKIVYLLVGLLFFTLIVKGGFDALDTPEIGFTVDVDLVVTSLGADGSAYRAGMDIGDRVLSINGEPAQAGDRIAEQGRKARIGQVMTYRIRKTDGRTRDIDLTWKSPSIQRRQYIGVNAVSAVLILIVATIAYLRKPGYLPANLFYFLCLFYLFFRMDHPRWQAEYWARIYQVIYLFCFFLIPAVFAHFCALFPKPNRFLNARKSRIIWLYSPSTVLFFPAAVTNWIHYDNVKATGIITKIIIYEGFVLWAVLLTAGSLMMIHAFFRIRSRTLARRSSIVFYSLALAMLPYLIVGFLENFLDRTFTYEITGLILFLPFPTALAWAIDYGEDRPEPMPTILEKILRSRD